MREYQYMDRGKVVSVYITDDGRIIERDNIYGYDYNSYDYYDKVEESVADRRKRIISEVE